MRAIKFVVRVLGVWLLAAAFVAFVIDGTRSIANGALTTTPLGATMFAIDPSMLNTAQAAVQRYIAPWVWDPVIVWLLEAPTFLTMGLIGAALVLAGRKPGRHRLESYRTT